MESETQGRNGFQAKSELAANEIAAQAQIVHVRVMGRLGSPFETAQLCLGAMVANMNCGDWESQDDLVAKLALIVEQHRQQSAAR